MQPATLLAGGASLGGADTQIWAGRKGAGAAPGALALLAFGGETGCGRCGEITPPLLGSTSFCLLLPGVKLCLWEQSLHWDLAKKGPFHHLLGCLRGTPGTTNPFNPQGSLSWPRPGAGLPLLCGFCDTVATRPLHAGTPQDS